MNTDEAFAKLGLKRTASRKEITEAYRKKSKALHPDTLGGSTSVQAELNEAKSIALDQSSESRELTVWREKLPAIEQAVSGILFQQQGERIKNELIQEKSSSLTLMKKMVAIGALVMAIATASVQMIGLPKKLLPAEVVTSSAKQEGASLNTPAKNSDPAPDLTWIFGASAACFGVGFAFLKYFSDQLTIRIERYNDALSYTGRCARELAELMNYEDRKIIDLEKIVSNDIRERRRRRNLSFKEALKVPPLSPFTELGLSLRLTAADRAPLVFKKAQEHKLIKKIDFQSGSSEFKDQYEVLFTPSAVRRL